MGRRWIDSLIHWTIRTFYGWFAIWGWLLGLYGIGYGLDWLRTRYVDPLTHWLDTHISISSFGTWDGLGYSMGLVVTLISMLVFTFYWLGRVCEDIKWILCKFDPDPAYFEEESIVVALLPFLVLFLLTILCLIVWGVVVLIRSLI